MPPIHALPRFLNANRRLLRLKNARRERSLMAASSSPPAALAAALDALLDGQPRKELQASAQRLSEGFRARRPSSETIRDETDALAYALTRLPATYAATASVLAPAFARRFRSFRPRAFSTRAAASARLLRGAGNSGRISPDVELFDRSAQFLELAGRLIAGQSPRGAGAGAGRRGGFASAAARRGRSISSSRAMR